MSATLAPPTRKVPAHFDGRAFVPDEPVDLPVGREVIVNVPTTAVEGNGHGVDRNGRAAEPRDGSPPNATRDDANRATPAADPHLAPSARESPVLPLKFAHPPASKEEQLEALAWIRANAVDTGHPIPNWALDREWIYAEDHEVAAETRRRERLGIPDDDPEQPDDADDGDDQ